MNHNLTAERYGVRLRPVRMEDAGLIVRLRNSEHALGAIGDSATDVASQEAWLTQYFDRPDDYYFIVERVRDQQGVGALGIYDVQGTTGEWGRWVIEPGVLAAPSSAWLAFHTCFDVLGLEVVLGHVVESNSSVLAFHHRIGDPCLGVSPTPRQIGGETVNVIAFRATRSDWTGMSASLSRYAQAAQRAL